jgi:class 3 adenylate cyclase
MKCLACGSNNRIERRFCAECGAALKLLCTKCHGENEPGEKFCGSCGTALTSDAAPRQRITSARSETVGPTELATPPDGERKTVTTLFADIKGSMELIEDLDPEEARHLVDPALKLMIDAVHRYEGYVAQSTGDGIFALFGAPVAHEDHPQRALYAALRMQDEIRHYSDKLRSEGRQPLQVRVGANTGEVVMRQVATAQNRSEYVPVGHSTSLAARMQALAPIGSIAITGATRSLVEGYFLVKSLGPSKVRGVSEPVEVFEVTGLGPLRSRLQVAARRGFSKFVGRQRELEEIKRCAGLAIKGNGQIVAAVAEAGVGKSRLFFEATAIIRSGCMVLDAPSFSHGKASAYQPLIDLLKNYFEITDADDERKRREKINGKVLTLDRTLEDAAPYLLALLGLGERDDAVAQMDAKLRQRRTFESIKRLLLRESLNQPLIVVFEDLHWIDPETQAFLNMMIEAIATAQILLLVNYRPEYQHSWGNKTYYSQLRLDPLEQESAEEMLTALLGAEAELVPVKRLVAAKTQGNPFFIEEMVLALFDQGALVRNGVVKLGKSASEIRVPATVQGVLASRIDRLPPREKELLQTLALMGKEFPLALVRRVVDDSSADLEAMLSKLLEAEFIYEQPALSDTEYTFKHALTQDVASNSMLIERRKNLHERIGDAMLALYAAQLDAHLSKLAHHYGRSANLEKTLDYAHRAGNYAVQRSATAEALTHFATALGALEHLPHSSERLEHELDILVARGAVLSTMLSPGDPEARKPFARARDLSLTTDGNRHAFPITSGLFLSHMIAGEFNVALELARELIVLADRGKEPRKLYSAKAAMGWCLLELGELAAACEHLETAMVSCDLHQRGGGLGFIGDTGVHDFCHWAMALWARGFPQQAHAKSAAASEAARELGHPFSLTLSHMYATFFFWYLRDAETVLNRADAAIKLATEYDFQFLGFQATTMRGWALVSLGRLDEGLAMMRAAEPELRQRGAMAWIWLGAAFADGCLRTEQAEAAIEIIDARLKHLPGDHLYKAELFRIKGEAILARDSSAVREAEHCFRTSIEIARRQEAKSWELRSTMSLARLLVKQGKRDEARAMLSEIYNWFTEGFDTADLKDAKALLEKLS